MAEFGKTVEERVEHFAGDDPFEIMRGWMDLAGSQELNDPSAAALATVDQGGMPNVRMVLLRDIGVNSFVFYTNYGSAKAREIDQCAKAAFVIHWKSIRRQVRARGLIKREDGEVADRYFASRSLQSRYGAWASRQSTPLASRGALMTRVAQLTLELGANPERPPFWGGYRMHPLEIEFWSDGNFRLHDRFQWRRESPESDWEIRRLSP